MKIEQLSVTVGEVCEGYVNDAEEGVVGYGGLGHTGTGASSSITMRNASR